MIALPPSPFLRVAAAGLGWVMRHRHFPAIKKHPALQLVGVVDRKTGRAEDVARRYNIPHHAETDDLSAIPWLNDVDAIVIGAPPMAHAALVTQALRLGKHVLTEKPFAMTLSEGEEMAATAQSANRVLAVVHNFQFGRAAQKLKRDLAAGNLGPIKRIAATQFGNPRRRLPSWFEHLPLGLFYDESPHFFYLLRELANGLSLRQAYSVPAPDGEATPSSIHLLYRGAQNIPVTIDCQFDSALSEWFLVVTGEQALGIVDIFRDIYIRLPQDGQHALPQILRTSASAILQHVAQHIPNGWAYLRGRLDYGNDTVYARFVDAIRRGEPPQDIAPQDALAVLKLQHEAIEALQRNQVP